MKSLTLLAAGAAALALAACGDHVQVKVEAGSDEPVVQRVGKLDCPPEQGVLTRISLAADGRACAYEGGGAAVSLRLVSLDGEPAAAVLDPIEAELKALMPKPTPEAAEEGDGDDKVQITLPGVSISADKGGAKVKAGHTEVAADDDGAEIRSHKGQGAVDATFMLASDSAPKGYALVGYNARGPASGPLVVGVAKVTKAQGNNDVFGDMKALVKRNAGD